jgi:hypothetical protein
MSDDARPPVKRTGGLDGPREGTEGRNFEYFQPAGRRPTLYEDVTIDTQPSPHRHLDRGWLVRFADGRDTYEASSTRLAHQSWYDFRDPNQLWERVYYQQGAGYERQIENTIAVARADGQPGRLSAEWVEYLRAHMQQAAFVEQGLWLAIASSARAALSDTITHFMAFEAGFKQRQAQAIVLYAMDMEADHGEFSMDAARESWLADEPWQGVRAYVEKLNTLTDWGEVLVAANVCLDPVVGVLLRRELFERGGAANHDTVTPAVFNVAQLEYQQIQRFTGALIEFVCADVEHGEANREVIQGWVDEWLPEAREAAIALQPLFAAQPEGADFAAALARVQQELAAAMEPLGIAIPARVPA